VLTLALAAGIRAETATQLANFAGGAVVEKLGTATATPAEIVELMEHDSSTGSGQTSGA
jgi:bifunctional ADP-heptose synthase (sugar kinase/adenylyltransferase)